MFHHRSPANSLTLFFFNSAPAQLGRAGLRRYEVSNFARSGSECRHNLHIWHGGDYIGLGPGRMGKESIPKLMVCCSCARLMMMAAGAHGRYRARSGDTLRTIQTPATTVCGVLGIKQRWPQNTHSTNLFRAGSRKLRLAALETGAAASSSRLPCCAKSWWEHLFFFTILY